MSEKEKNPKACPLLVSDNPKDIKKLKLEKGQCPIPPILMNAKLSNIAETAGVSVERMFEALVNITIEELCSKGLLNLVRK
ncbi:MAG: hypothetical protein QXQ94_02165 [Candidatus Bathyarchaeia archaeon]